MRAIFWWPSALQRKKEKKKKGKMGDMRSCSDAGAVHFSQRSGAPQRTAEMNCKVLARESPSERAQNEWQGALNTTPSCHRRGNSGT